MTTDNTLSTAKTAPGPRGRTLYKLGALIQDEPLETFRFLHMRYGDAVFCDWFKRPFLFLFKPEYIRHVLKDNHANYVKSEEYRIFQRVLGEGLLTSDGEKWRQMRKIVAKEFHTQRVDEYLPLIRDVARKTLSELHHGEVQDVNRIFKETTLSLACQIFFGINTQTEMDLIGEIVDSQTHLASRLVRSPIRIPYSVPTPSHVKSKKLLALMNRLVDRVIDNGSEETNVLSRLLTAEDNISRKQIRDEVVTLMMAGHETVTSAMTWTIYYLAKHPQWIREIKEELRGIDFRTAEDYERCIKLKAVLLESLRLTPPIPLVTRQALEDDEIDGISIPRNVSIVACCYVAHRDSRYWNDPESFLPERFIGRELRRDDFTYFPFARGPRGCIGEKSGHGGNDGHPLGVHFVIRF